MAKKKSVPRQELTRQIRNLRRRLQRLRRRVLEPDCDPGAPGEAFSVPLLGAEIHMEILRLEGRLQKLKTQRQGG